MTKCMKINIRNAIKEEAQALGSIYSQSYRTAFKGIISDNILENVFSPEKRAEGLMREISEGASTNAIMLDENKPIGLLTYGKPHEDDADENTQEILRIYTLPDYWGKSLGKAFMSWAIDEIKSKGYNKVSLWVIEENYRARKLYEKLGFVHDGITRIIDVGKEIVDLRYIKNI